MSVTPEQGHQVATELLTEYSGGVVPLLWPEVYPSPPDLSASHRLQEGLTRFQRRERNTADSCIGAEMRMGIAMETKGPGIDFNCSL